MSEEEIKLPNYNDIVVRCIGEMNIKFTNYGNDWTEKDDLYWKERILKEVKEYEESMTEDSEKRKLLNIINMAAMAFETVKIRGCRQHEVRWGIILKSKDEYVNVKCTICDKPVQVLNGIIREAN